MFHEVWVLCLLLVLMPVHYAKFILSSPTSGFVHLGGSLSMPLASLVHALRLKNRAVKNPLCYAPQAATALGEAQSLSSEFMSRFVFLSLCISFLTALRGLRVQETAVSLYLWYVSLFPLYPHLVHLETFCIDSEGSWEGPWGGC